MGKAVRNELLDLVSKVHWTIEGQDRLLWERNNQKVYTVKSGYSVVATGVTIGTTI